MVERFHQEILINLTPLFYRREKAVNQSVQASVAQSHLKTNTAGSFVLGAR